MLLFLFGSVWSNVGSSRRGAIVTVLSSSFSISSERRSRWDLHDFSKFCICWIISSCLSILLSSLSNRSQIMLIDLVSCAICVVKSVVGVMVLIVCDVLVLGSLTTDAQVLLPMDVFV